MHHAEQCPFPIQTGRCYSFDQRSGERLHVLVLPNTFSTTPERQIHVPLVIGSGCPLYLSYSLRRHVLDVSQLAPMR